MPTNWSQNWTPTVRQVQKADKPKAAPKPSQINLGITEQTQINQAENDLNKGKALRKYQEDQTKATLSRTLATLDRSKIDSLKNVSNDYASRGMMRSGGFMQQQADTSANIELQKTQALDAARQEADLNAIENIYGTEAFEQLKQSIIQQYLAAKAANKINQTGTP